MTPVWTVDFETMPIGPRPDHNPPEPVGVSIRPPDSAPAYWAWGHASGNTCSRDHAHALLTTVWRSDLPVVFHNAKFDLPVAYKHFGLPTLPWERVHDTMFLGFLLDPYSRSIGLKQLGQIWLGMAPDEQDAVVDWVLAHKDSLPRFPWIKNSKGEPNGNPTKKNAGAWIAYAPGELIGPYANGDTERTWRLFQVMAPAVAQAGMNDAYDVERRLLPHLIENERVGLRVDLPRLQHDLEMYRAAFGYAEDWLRWRLNSGGLNLDADADVADALERTGVVTDFPQTKTGRRSVAKDSLHPDMFHDPQVASVLGYRNRLKTCLTMFMAPWETQAAAFGGHIATDWNQVSSDMGGARTGRPSTRNPNLLNISKTFEDKGDGYRHPDFIPGLPPLPVVRRYVLPDEGHVINGRDFQGQELRVFAHYEQGDLLRQYQADPEIDVHQYVSDKITDLTGQALGRGKTKTMNFQAIYGGGIPAAQAKLRCTYAEAKQFKAFHDMALPGRRILADQLSMIVRTGGAVKTYGGRLYVRPPFKTRNGRLSDADYILINYLIQGSAADITKRAILAMLEDPDYKSRFMVQVYDELVTSSPVEVADDQSRVMGRAMAAVPLRVPLLTDAEQGPNWGEMVERTDL